MLYRARVKAGRGLKLSQKKRRAVPNGGQGLGVTGLLL